MIFRADEIRLIGVEKEMLGVMSLNEALDKADEESTDVVLISPDAQPPVCRLVDVSKYKYEQEKAKRRLTGKCGKPGDTRSPQPDTASQFDVVLCMACLADCAIASKSGA